MGGQASLRFRAEDDAYPVRRNVRSAILAPGTNIESWLQNDLELSVGLPLIASR